jgi:hypothetical protein
LFDAGDVGRALELFLIIYEFRPTAVALFNMGACLQQLGDVQEALDAFRRYVEEYAATASAQDLADVRTRIQSLLGAQASGTAGAGGQPPPVVNVGDQAPMPPAATPAPRSPSSAQAPATMVPAAAVPAALPAETPAVAAPPPAPAAAPGPAATSPDVGGPVATPSRTAGVLPVPAPPPSSGSVRIVASPPGATIEVNGEAIGTGRATWLSEPGSFELVVTADGYAEHHSQIEVVAGEDRTMSVDLEKTADYPLDWWWSLVIIGGLAAVVTAVAVPIALSD